ncbi:MAG: efflux RND transporter periplasmic adaptor subunit [Planctomycetota bacterium]
MRALLVYTLALLAVAAGVAFTFFDVFAWFGGAAAEGAAQPNARTVPVITAPVVRATFADSLEALGTVRANESIHILSKRADHVTAVEFEDGQEVAAGQLLVELNTTEERSMLAEATALREERQAAYDRAQELRGRDITPESEVITAHAQLAAQQARIATLEATIAEHQVRAPFAGRLGLRQVSVGAYLQPSTVITTLDDLSVVKVDFTIPETWLAAVREGMPVSTRTDAWRGQDFPGEVSAIDTQLDPRTRSATVRALVPNPDRRLRPGMLMRVVVDRGEAAVLQVPEEALVQTGTEHHVMVVGPDHVARKQVVTIGRRRVGRVEVLDGLSEGAMVVVEGLVRVRPDTAVEVVATRGGGS